MVTYPELQNFSSYKEKNENYPDPYEQQDENQEQEKEKDKEKKDKAKEEHEKERHICDPMCLLYAKNGNLVPLAIQLTQNPTVNTPIYTK